MISFKEVREGVTIMEGVNDPSIFKAVFLAGGPGSGKSFVVGKTALKALGFRLINSDDAFEKGLKNSSKSDDNVIDLFLGSGSTLIACEKLDRICYGMELDPKYCDVIIKRWENFTGKKAELENGQK